MNLFVVVARSYPIERFGLHGLSYFIEAGLSSYFNLFGCEVIVHV